MIPLSRFTGKPLMMTRDEELRAIRRFVHEYGVLRCPSQHDIAVSNGEIPMSLEAPVMGRARKNARTHRNLWYRLPFDGVRIKDGFAGD